MDGVGQVGVVERVDEVPILGRADPRVVAGPFAVLVVPVDDEIEERVSHEGLEPARADAGAGLGWSGIVSLLAVGSDGPEVVEGKIEGDDLMGKESFVVLRLSFGF